MSTKLLLKPGKERSVMNFHPWVFSGAIQGKPGDLQEGDLVDLMSFDGRFLGKGHYHSGSIMVRILTFQDETIDETFYQQRFRDALSVRKVCNIPSEKTGAFRLIHGEGDGLPGLVIDIYGKHAVIQTHNVGMTKSVGMIGEALDQLRDELPLETIYFKQTDATGSKQTGANRHLKGSTTSDTILENGLRFYVDWETGQKTGFFLDQRNNRALLGSYAKDKNVLNTFCYSGGFSVYARASDAKHVDSVDSSQKAIEWTRRNMEMASGTGTHEAYAMDVFDFLKSRQLDYDIIILDPPAFAKRLHAVDQAVIGYRNLNYEAIRGIKSGGMIFTFSCSQAVDTKLFRKTVFTAAAKAGRNVRILHQLTQGTDHPINIYHPEGEYLKGLVLLVD